MTRKLLTFGLAFVVSASAAIRPSPPKTNSLPDSVSFVPTEVLIGLLPESELAVAPGVRQIPSFNIRSLDRLNARFQVQKTERIFAGLGGDPLAAQEGLPRIYKLTLAPGQDVFEAIRLYVEDPNVEFAEPNLIFTAARVPSDPDFGKQWGLHNLGQSSGRVDADIDAPEAWDIELGKQRMTIAIVDTGVDYNHPDLAGDRVLTNLDRDFVNNDQDAMDDHGHGTYVAGIAAANSDNGLGISGVCWVCRILPVKVLNEDGKGTSDTVAKGIRYAAAQNAKIISMSLGYKAGCGCSKTVAAAINYAYEKGSLLIAASGNDSNKKELSYPASSPRVLAVGATDRQDREADFSNRAPALDLLAPGKDVYSLDRSSEHPQYREASGTSAATPFVSGVAGLLWSAHPELRNAQVWRTLCSTVDKVPGLSFGRVNAKSTLTKVSRDSFPAARDTCSGEPTDCPPGCGAELALASVPEFTDSVAVLQDVRDLVLAPTALGREWIGLYQKHRMEVARIILADRALRLQVRRALRSWMPIFQAAVRGEDSQAQVTERNVRLAREALDVISERASPKLRKDLEEARGALDRKFLVVGLGPQDLVAELRNR